MVMLIKLLTYLVMVVYSLSTSLSLRRHFVGEGKSLKFAVFGPSLPPSRDWGYAGAGTREGTY